MHSLDSASLMAHAWADPARGVEDFPSKSEAELTHIVQGREAFALFGWKPYMHNPRLKHWLHRIKTPTMIVWGEQDRIIPTAYAAALKDLIPGSEVQMIAGCGHMPHVEKPEAFLNALNAFAEGRKLI